MSTFICIDLKSFYASVECVERGLNPLTTNLVVADSSRTEKTICLAVSPSLKSYGIPGRARLFEVVQKLKNVNIERIRRARNHKLVGSSVDDIELKEKLDYKVDYIAAVPRMALYMEYSKRIYGIYLKYVSKDDIYPYSIDEIFCDITNYLSLYKMTARNLVTKMIQDVYKSTGITATAGIGTNMYLCKIAMDIVAKHMPANENGVRIAELDEMSYRKLLWAHKPLTDFWRVGPGYRRRLEAKGIYTMGDIAKCSIENEELLYKLLGVNAELLIDHAWGWEPCTLKEAREYKPRTTCLSSGQVLHCPYDYKKTKLIIKEMVEGLSLDLSRKGLVTNQLVLTVGYDVNSLNLVGEDGKKLYNGEITIDRYGRKIPKHAHGTINIDHKTSSTKILSDAAVELFERIINPDLLTRRLNITANNLESEAEVKNKVDYEQINLFTDYTVVESKKKKEEQEKKLQKAVLEIKKKYGKNAILKGMNFEDGGTAIERNGQIGGHKE
ncbi:MAG: DNA methylase [Clostridia bacterium]|nr:DNA methylase [Clostridia bacterium]